MIELNKIYNENNLETMARMEGGSVDLIVTSPPYDDLRTYNGYSFDFEATAKELFRVLKDGGVCVWIAGDETKNGDESGTCFRQVLRFKEIGFLLFDTMIYVKDSCPFPRVDKYNQIFEYMFVLSRGKRITFNPIRRKNNWGGLVKQMTHRQKNGALKSALIKYKKESNVGNVWQYGTGFMKSTDYKEAFEHPAIFPEDLARDHILSWSNPGDTIYDPFLGSGTTAVVAEKYKRNWIGSEISPEYCRLAQKRIDNHRAQVTMEM